MTQKKYLHIYKNMYYIALEKKNYTNKLITKLKVEDR